MTTNTPAAETQQADPSADRCANCDAELAGEYCAHCGQKRIHRQEFAVKSFGRHLVNEITDLESNKIFRTFSALLFKPGFLTAEYLAGRKKLYIGPVRLYLTLSAIYFLFAWGTLAGVRGGGANRIVRNSEVVARAQQRAVSPQTMAERIYERAEKYSAVLRFASVLVSGLFLSLLYFRAKRYYVEHLIFSFHYYSFDFLCKSFFALMFIVAAALGAKLPSMVLNLFYPLAFIYLMFALRRAYRQSWAKTVLKSVVLFICETILFVAINIAGFVIAFVFA